MILASFQNSYRRTDRLFFVFQIAIPYPSEDDLVNDINKQMPTSPGLGGIVFTKLEQDANITYKIRLSAKLRNSGTG